MRRLAFALAAAGAAVALAAPAHANLVGGRCGGPNLALMCTYCSYLGGGESYPESWCADPANHPGYVSRTCVYWYDYRCAG